MKPSPFFSIVIPTYNRADCLVENLSALLRQSFESYEIVVVDDGSTDNTEAVVMSLSSPRIRYFKTENSERSHARNFGMRVASGQYINYFDSDDVMYDNRLETVYNFIVERQMPDVLFTHYDFVDSNKKQIGTVSRYYQSFTDDLLFNNFLACGSVFLKRMVARNFNFNEDRRLITAEDWELWLRVHTTHEFVECKASTFAIRQHEQRSLAQISANRIEERDGFFASLVLHNKNFENSFGRMRQHLFVADRYTFIALSYAIIGSKKLAGRFLIKALNSTVRVVGRRRFWGVIKNML